VWQIESGLGGGTDGMGTGSIGTRNTFIGLAGGFGTFVMGRHDTPYKIATGKYDIFGDTIGDYNLGRLPVSASSKTPMIIVARTPSPTSPRASAA
jgi:predicted porin